MGIRGQERIIVSFFILATLILFSTSCDKYIRYRVLNFFFDGVPHPDKPQESKEPVGVKTARLKQIERAESPPAPPRYKHPPAEGKDDCSFCHGPMNRMVLPPKDMCLKCHTHVKGNLAFIHGPAVVDCVVCHNVHES